MGMTRLEVDLTSMDHKKFKPSVLFALRANSFYDTKTHTRKIKKSEASGRKLANVIHDANKDNVLTSISKLKEAGIVKEDGKFYIIEDIQDGISYKDMDTDFIKELVAKRSSEYIMTYLWLYRRWEWKKSLGQSALFSIGDILRSVFDIQYKNGFYYEKVRDIIADMVSDGLLVYNVIKVNDTFLRAIVTMRTKFIISDIVKEQDGIYFGNKNDYTQTVNIKMDEDEPKVIESSIGVKEAPKLQLPSKCIYVRAENGALIAKDISFIDSLFEFDEISQEELDSMLLIPQNSDIIKEEKLAERFPQYDWTVK